MLSDGPYLDLSAAVIKADGKASSEEMARLRQFFATNFGPQAANEVEKIFVLNEGDYDSRILYWGQITSGGKCILNFYRGEELTTVNLIPSKLK